MGTGIPVEKVLKFTDKGISVEEARKRMLEAGEAPKGILKEVRKNAAVNPTPAQPVVQPTVSAPVRQPVPKREVATSAKLTVVTEDGTDGESTIISAETPQKLDAEIRTIHSQAQIKHQKIRVEFIADEPIEPVVQPEPTAVVVEEPVTAPVVAPVVVSPIPVEQPERIENAKFILEIKQEDGEWIGEITYKNGAGIERFTAPSRNALNLKLLEGKANATLRVREAIRREKYGTELDKVYTLPDYLTQEAYDALPKEAQMGILDTIATNEGNVFKELHPEYWPNEDNSVKIQKFLNKRGLPFTLRNIEFAFEELMESEELDIRPTPKPTVVAPSVPSPAPRTEDSVAAVVPVTPVAPAPVVPATPAPQVRKRGTTGLQPGHSSAANTELETATEEANKPSEPSVAELRKSSPIGKPPSDDLRRAYQNTLVERRKARQF